MKYLSNDTETYFASANSFKGFKSNFAVAFDPELFDRIYILKGGPGTGKSSLMKRVGKEFESEKCRVTSFLCSSDPASLDGVIVSKNGKKVALIDGTAPHMADPQLPGACEKIINLADALNGSALLGKKTEISSLLRKKKESYAKAYRYLGLAGNIHDAISDIINNSKVYTEAELICDDILGYELFAKAEEKMTDFYYLSAFGKDGYVRLDIPCIEKEYISLNGDGFTEYIVMHKVYEKLLTDSLLLSAAYSPLTDNNIEVLTTESCIISTDNIGGIVFDTTPLSLFFDREYYELTGAYKNMLNLAKSYFECASEYHFALERIYTCNIDFSYNDQREKEIKNEMKEIFSQ